jgi:hypothetical protein
MQYEQAANIVQGLEHVLTERQHVFAQRIGHELESDRIIYCNLAYLKGMLASMMVDMPQVAQYVVDRLDIVNKDIDMLQSKIAV